MAEKTIQSILGYVGLAGKNQSQLLNRINNLLAETDPMQYSLQKKELTQELLEGYKIGDKKLQSITKGGMFGLPVEGNVELRMPGAEPLVLTSPIIQANQTKQVLTTALVRHDGTVKEHVSLGDWQISIKGLFCSHEEKKPIAELVRLLNYVRTAREIEMVNPYINALGVHSVVVTALDLPHSPFANIITYQLSLLSDKPFELKYKDKRNV